MSTITIISISSLIVILGVCSGISLYYYINNEYDKETSNKQYYFSGFETSSCENDTDCGFGLICDSLTKTCKKSEGMSCHYASDCSTINGKNVMCNTYCTPRETPLFKIDTKCPCSNSQVCVGGTCKLKYSETCKNNNECYSSKCKNNKCDQEDNNVNQRYLSKCDSKDNCPENYTCQTYTSYDLSNRKSNVKVCVNSLGGLNSICSDNSECGNLFTCSTSNKCISTITDICPLGAIGTNTCVYSSKQSCKSNDQCDSNVCSSIPRIYSFNFLYEDYSSRNIFNYVKDYYTYPLNVKLDSPLIDKMIVKSRGVTDIFIAMLDNNINVYNTNLLVSSINISDLINDTLLDISNVDYEGEYIILLFKKNNFTQNVLYLFNIQTNELILLDYILDGYYDKISAITRTVICCWNSVNKQIKTCIQKDDTYEFITVIDEFGKPLQSDLLPMFFYPKPYDLCYVKNNKISFFANSFFVPLINSNELNLIREEIKIPNIKATSINDFSIVFDYNTLNINVICICSDNDTNYVSVRRINIIKDFSTILEVNSVIEADLCCNSLNAYYTISKSSCK